VKKIIFFLPLFLIISFHNSFPLFRPVQELESSNVKRVIISPFDSKVICVASKNSLYKSQDAGQKFEKVAVFKDEDVQHIFFDSSLAETVYVVTSRHIYRLKNTLEKLFSSSDEEIIYTAVKYRGLLYIGTSQGLSSASEDVLIWRRVKALSDFAIYFLEPSADNLYLATERGAYLLKDDQKVERLFVMRKEDAVGEEGLVSQIIKVDVLNKGYLWLGTNHGLYVSEDKGDNWRKLYISGIDNLSINCLAQTKLEAGTIYLGTTKGLFMVDLRRNKSKQLFEGLYSSYISWIEFTPEGKIYLATSKGLFDNDYFSSAYSENNLEMVLGGEPSIGEVQEAVLVYNGVHPDKIKKWRQGLKYRGFFPTVSLDYDKTISVSTNPSYKESVVGPYDWGVSLSWNVGDLLWNSYEDDVDTRARLNTQLRLDVLDEINRVYFERIRLKRELTSTSLSEEDLFKKRLRLAELTAIIDGYTGGYFSKQVRERDAR